MQRNYILFVFLSILVMAGWLWLEYSYFRMPPQPRSAQQAEQKKLTPKEEAIALGAGLIGEQAAGAAAGPWLRVVDTLKFYAPQPARWSQIAEPWRPALHLLPNDPLQALVVAAQIFPPVVKPAGKPIVETTLGGEGFHLEAKLSSLGAGVRSVTLRRFKAANYLGRPTDHKLQLIPDDPIQPSYLLHHYPDPARPENPVLGLGETAWDFDGKKVVDDVEEASYSTHVPGTPHLKLTKTFRLGKHDYHLGMLLTIQDERERSAEGLSFFRYQLTGAHGLPVEGEWYTQTFRNAFTLMVQPGGGRYRVADDAATIAFRDGAARVPVAPRGDSMLQYAATANQYFAAAVVPDNQQPPKEDGGVPPGSIIAWARATHESEEHKCYFLGVIGDSLEVKEIDQNAKLLTFRTFRLLPHVKDHIEKDLAFKENEPLIVYGYVTPAGQHVATWARQGHAERPQLDDITNRVTSEVVELKAGRKISHQFVLYHGPVKAAQLGTFSGEEAVPPELVDRYTHVLNLDTMTDWPSNWFVQKIYFTDLVIFFTKLMHWLLNGLYAVVGNYGISIMLLTVIVRGAMFPISRRQAMFSVKMQELAPELKKIGEKYKNDPQEKMRAQSELYKKHHIHPLGSCLPMLMQLPIFLGLYFALQESIHFRLASFFWMPNLAAPDMLAWWSEHIPLISDPGNQAGSFWSFFYLGPYFNLLPVIAVVLMVIQQQLMMPPPTDEQQEAQQKMMKFMSIFFGILFYKMAAGLCIYFIATSLWGLAERRLLPRKQPPAAAAVPLTKAKPAPPTAPKGRGRGPQRKQEETALDKLKAWWEDVLEQARKK